MCVYHKVPISYDNDAVKLAVSQDSEHWKPDSLATQAELPLIMPTGIFNCW